LIVRGVFAAGFLALGVAYYYGLGPPPSPSELMDLPWWRPRGFLVRWARPVEGIPWGAVLVFAALPQALVLLGIRLLSLPVARALVFALGLTLSLLTLSGFVFPIGWSFFSWRFPVVVLASALFCSGAFFLPSLLASTLRQARTPRALIVCGGVLAMYVLSTEITGWEPSLSANLSPWPILTLFGFLLIGYLIAALHVAAGLGAWLAARTTGRRGRLGGAVVAALAGSALAAVRGAEASVGFVIAMGLASAAYALLAARGKRAARAARAPAPVRILAGALLGATIFLSNWAGVRNHQIARNQTAPPILDALEAYRVEQGEYPEVLEDLVPGHLSEIPRPRMGWIAHDDERFTYLNFGDSYTLEFPSILWIQCSYSPPFSESYFDDDEGELDLEEAEPEEPLDTGGGEDESGLELGGSWTCDTAPPRLW
jgi:hypothetical protein